MINQSTRFLKPGQQVDQKFVKTNQGLTDIEGAKLVARKIMENFSQTKQGQIVQMDCMPMLVEIYNSFNQQFCPQNQDMKNYFSILDRNGDGKVDYQDIEKLCVRYLCPRDIQQQEQQEKVKRKKFVPEIEQRLDVARRLFKQFDVDKSNFIEEKEVYNVLIQTYQQIGINYQPTQQDIISWIQMSDSEHKDGKISLPEYENIIIKSLEKQGFKIEFEQIAL